MLLLSAQELCDQRAAAGGEGGEVEALEEYRALLAQLSATLKDKTTPHEDEQTYDRATAEVRRLTALLYPKYCTKPDAPGDAAAQLEAAIQELYALHENPEIGEDERLTVYHCRAIIDAQWRVGEMVDEAEAGLWFCGKLMAGPVSQYSGRNEKSRLTVKVAPRAGPAPSGEPRMSYDDQRQLFAHMRERRAAYATLEESELRDRVVRQSRGHVALPIGSGGAAGGAGPQISTAQLRPIHPQREERIVSE